jgi:hypothetical protein
MRNIVFKDTKISQTAYDKLVTEYTAFIKKQTGITPIFYTIDKDYTDYPTVLDTDGDDVMRPDFLQDIADDVDMKYGEWGGDNIITLIHSDNWKSGKTATRRGIWGTNYSYKYNNYHLQYCRFDARNGANSFGTLNHEIDHSLDALIKQELGININPILGVVDYDKNTTHGQPEAYHAYIRYQENAAKLKVLAPYLVAAYKKRQDRHTEAVRGMQFTIIGLLEKLVYLYKAKLNQKNGNPNS